MDDLKLGFNLGLLIGGLCTGLLVGFMCQDYWQDQIQQRGYSEYCQDDGSWSWKGECK